MEDSDVGNQETIPGLNMPNGFQGKVILSLNVSFYSFFCGSNALIKSLSGSRCEYLLQEKGQEFVHQIQARFPRLFEQVCHGKEICILAAS